jgi:hypothetical protein
MVANEIFVNCNNFNPIWVQNASIYVKKYTGTRVKKGKCQGMLLNLFKAGAGAGPATKEIFSAPQHHL